MRVHHSMEAAPAEGGIPVRPLERESVQAKGSSHPNKGELVPEVKSIQAGVGLEPDWWVEFLPVLEKRFQKKAV